eukprot:jgi/Hompol1/2760/HPOL_003022-RA
MQMSVLLHLDPYAAMLRSFPGCDSSSNGNGLDGIPSITQLQQGIEDAWAQGYDTVGAEQLRWRLVGTRKWIGTTECATLLNSLGIRTQIYDFHAPSGPNGTHPALIEFLVNHFRTRPAPPIYLQYQGHSQTVVGVERTWNGASWNLLIFDPGDILNPALQQQILSVGIDQLDPSDQYVKQFVGHFRVQPSILAKRKQYSLFVVDGVERDPALRVRELTSHRIE